MTKTSGADADAPSINMNTTEPLRPGPAPAGQPAWIYFPNDPQGYHFHDGQQADMPHQWLPAPACPPRPVEKTVEELDLEHFKRWAIDNNWGTSFITRAPFLAGIRYGRYGRAGGVRRFARELLKISQQFMSPSQKWCSVQGILDEAAKLIDTD